MKNTPKFLIIHGSDASYRKIPDQFLSINDWHAQRGFPVSDTGYFVGYHKVITGDKIYTARRDDEVGAHCNQHEGGVSVNFQSIGICMGFDGDIEMPTPKMYELLQKEVWAYQDKYKIPNDRVRFHRYYAPKTCPGSLITAQWLSDLLKRPEPIAIKPESNMCMAQEKVIAEQNVVIARLRQLVQDFIKWRRS